MTDTTTIEITKEQWKELNSRKEPGDSMKDVLARLLEGRDQTARDAAESDERVTQTDPPGSPTAEPTNDETTGELVAEVDALDTVDFPDSRNASECRQAVLAAKDYLRADGPASMREIVREVMPDHSLGYEVPQLEEGERYRGAWWRHVVKPGLEVLPNVQSPKQGASEWRVRE